MNDINKNLTFVNENLLAANNLQHQDLLSALDVVSECTSNYADIYLQLNYHETWIMENNIIKDGSYNINKGVGVRVINSDKTGFAYSNQLTKNALIESAILARNISNKQTKNNKNSIIPIRYRSLYDKIDPLSSLSENEKIELLMRINTIARSEDQRVKEVYASLSGIYEQILITATDGTLAADIRPLIQLLITVQVEQDGKREQGSSGGGGRYGYDFFMKPFMNEVRLDYWAKEAVRIALINLSAIEAPAGAFPVVLGSGWPGILLHEAVGHGLEGDFNRRCSSVFNNKLGKKVASEYCNIVDDGTLIGLRGSLSIDDEGVPSKYNILIKNGILKSYMQDKLNAKLMNTSVTGNGRRESYACLPMPRMTNTYMLPGNYTPNEIINSVEHGVYAANFSGGQVDITSGKFVFSTSEAYLIEKGNVTKPIKRATLIGSGIDIMQNVSMVGNDLKLDSGIGTCMKNGQSVPVGVGQPTVKIDRITIGGTA